MWSALRNRFLSVAHSPEPPAQRWLWVLSGCACSLAIGALDAALPKEVILGFLYLLPVGLATWMAGPAGGGLVAAVTIGVRALPPLWAASGAPGAPGAPGAVASWVAYWNVGALAVAYLVFVRVLAGLHEALRREAEAARTDPLTGLPNRKAFLERIDEELARAKRSGHSVTCVYIDLDNFKAVNDARGHDVGDRVLQAAAEVLRERLRKADGKARLGGDEFAVLLVEIDFELSRHVLTRLRRELLAAMEAGGWPVTFSIGAVTSPAGSVSADGLVRTADALMYDVKRSGKDRLKCMRLEGEEAAGMARIGSVA